MDGLPVDRLVDIGGWAFVAVLVLVGFIRGWLLASSQVDKIVESYKTVLQDKNEQIASWREAFNNSDARADILAENQRKLLESNMATNSLLQQLLWQQPIKDRETSK